MSNLQLQYNIEVRHDLSSDHNPAVLQNGSRKEDEEEHELLNKLTNWHKFAYYLEHHSTGIKAIHTIADLEQAVQSVEDDATSAIRLVTRTINQTKPRYNISREFKELIRQKQGAKKEAQLTGSPAAAVYNNLQHQVRSRLYFRHKERWTDKLNEIEHDQSELWKLARNSVDKEPLI